MTTFTIITTDGNYTVDGERWTRDSDGNVFVYDTHETGTDVDPVAEIEVDIFNGILRE
jgi:hypothetical protein